MLTIGRLAEYAGVTIKAVRHYHERGLLPEPDRDSSGYRRYTARHAITLVKIKTLADAGVPLARVGELLAAGEDEFRAAIAEIDADLRDRAARIERSRQRVAALRAGDRMFVSSAVAGYLDRLRELGVSDRGVDLERDVWILMHAVSPREADGWAADKRAALEDPEFRAIYVAYDEAYDWFPDDPRLPALATRTGHWLAAHPPDPPLGAAARGAGERPDPVVARLAAVSSGAESPAWLRLAELLRQAEPRRV
ncbi:MerR family transcriptional regulator [Cryptosporangium phraense]|uniref:MerR family transcriptional regulator n=1 Tax=Cryptosporangium phraense TaxID=2593070 RepID=A0A545AS27_9ACTN|nr:MerR family transcriptional regulator [Cryptosporangium phraense]